MVFFPFSFSFSHFFSTAEWSDDIPIQAGDESGVGNVSQLISITEESEPTGSGSTTETQLGMRNNLVRSSKEILKTHKVPFPGFKKKDKDKEKEKDKSVSVKIVQLQCEKQKRERLI